MSFENIERDDQDKSKWDKKMSAKSGQSGPSPALIGLLVVIVLAIIFVVQNSSRVETEFLFFESSNRVWLTIFVAILIGVALDRLFSIWWRRRRARKNEGNSN
jgi:uncharacterized integral membrane protein